jgi:hypothetical protein
MANKDILRIDGDKDGKLHFYIAASYGGRRWAAEATPIDDENKNEKHVTQLGFGLVKATIRSLLKNDIISK